MWIKGKIKSSKINEEKNPKKDISEEPDTY